MEVEPWSQSLVSALEGGDAGAAAALYADEGRLMAAAAGVVCGRREIEAFWQAGLAVGLSSIDLDPTEAHVLGELVVELGRYSFAAGSDVERGHYVVLHRRTADGAWCRAVEVYNPLEER